VAQANELIHQSLRLKIMAALNASRKEGSLEFTRLKALVGATDGNLSTHLSTLEAAGYVAVEKDFVGKKPRTRVAMTSAGATVYREHRAYLHSLLDA
jgi:DNA-binding MarR family transcriptional regulator